MKVYVAAPYSDAEKVREVHAKLASMGFGVTSRWAEDAIGPEDLATMPLSSIRAAILSNDIGLKDADAVLVMAREGAGAAMYGEAARGLDAGKKVVWLGKFCLDAYRRGVARVASIEEAFAKLATIAEMVD